MHSYSIVFAGERTPIIVRDLGTEDQMFLNPLRWAPLPTLQIQKELFQSFNVLTMIEEVVRLSDDMHLRLDEHFSVSL